MGVRHASNSSQWAACPLVWLHAHVRCPRASSSKARRRLKRPCAPAAPRPSPLAGKFSANSMSQLQLCATRPPTRAPGGTARSSPSAGRACQAQHHRPVDGPRGEQGAHRVVRSARPPAIGIPVRRVRRLRSYAACYSDALEGDELVLLTAPLAATTEVEALFTAGVIDIESVSKSRPIDFAPSASTRAPVPRRRCPPPSTRSARRPSRSTARSSGGARRTRRARTPS